MARIIVKKESRKAQYYSEDLGEGVELRMLLIPQGKFMMGSPEDELERLDREGPQHEVDIEKFFLGRYPVTQAQWRVVAGWDKVERDLEVEPSYFKGDERPVEQVSWYDAVEFCDRLSRKTGREYRLPTEAEWEYACRAGTKTPFHFGETITTDLANYRGTDNEELDWKGSYGAGPKGEYREKTTDVGYFQVANNFGLYDMHGNVWEWCEDDWHNNYEGAPQSGKAWLEDKNISLILQKESEELSEKSITKLIRGGSLYRLPRYCRSASRTDYYAIKRDFAIGFRLACSSPRNLP